MRGLFFALAALSLFAAFSAYAEDTMYDGEGIQYTNGIFTPYSFYQRCLIYCGHGNSNTSGCKCLCSGLTVHSSRFDACLRGCHCDGTAPSVCEVNCKSIQVA